MAMVDFTWGDSVRIKADAPPQFRPDEAASVCGIREIETADQAEHFGAPIGSRLYLVELEEGEAIEVPGTWLDHA